MAPPDSAGRSWDVEMGRYLFDHRSTLEVRIAGKRTGRSIRLDGGDLESGRRGARCRRVTGGAVACWFPESRKSGSTASGLHVAGIGGDRRIARRDRSGRLRSFRRQYKDPVFASEGFRATGRRSHESAHHVPSGPVPARGQSGPPAVAANSPAADPIRCQRKPADRHCHVAHGCHKDAWPCAVGCRSE